MSVLNVTNLSHGFGDRAIFENVSFRYKGASKDEILSHEVQDGTTMMDNQGYDIAFKNLK